MSIEMENGVGSKEEGRDKEVAVTGHAWNFQADPEPGQGLGHPEAPERLPPHSLMKLILSASPKDSL